MLDYPSKRGWDNEVSFKRKLICAPKHTPEG